MLYRGLLVGTEMSRKLVLYHLVSVLNTDCQSPLALYYRVQRMICDSPTFCLE